MTADKTFTFEATQDELLSLLKSAARTELQNPGAFEALLRTWAPASRAREEIPPREPRTDDPYDFGMTGAW